MIEELIEEGQYQVALSRLTDMDDEMTRYYRLVDVCRKGPLLKCRPITTIMK